jgi:uncharacterized protein (DUF433 family)
MPNATTEIIDGEPYRYYPLGDHIVRAPGICGGRPTFKHTRIEIAGALDRVAAGETIDEIARGYRGRVPRGAILEAIQLVSHQYLEALPELAPA